MDLKFGQTFSPADELIEGLLLAEAEEDVDVIVILEEVLELHDVGMRKGTVNFDLRHELVM